MKKIIMLLIILVIVSCGIKSCERYTIKQNIEYRGYFDDYRTYTYIFDDYYGNRIYATIKDADGTNLRKVLDREYSKAVGFIGLLEQYGGD